MANEVKIADPGPLGLAGFGITTVILSLINAGVYKADAIGVVLGLAVAYGGGAQFIAGMWEFRKGNTFGATAFTSYGAFWISFYFIIKANPAHGLGIYLLMFGLLTFFLWFGTFYLNRALFFVFLTLWLAFLFLALGQFGYVSGAIGGWIGFICGLSALYTSAAGVLNDVAGRTVLPVGSPMATKSGS
jgi:succinate-acetate transporter protein